MKAALFLILKESGQENDEHSMARVKTVPAGNGCHLSAALCRVSEQRSRPLPGMPGAHTTALWAALPALQPTSQLCWKLP